MAQSTPLELVQGTSGAHYLIAMSLQTTVMTHIAQSNNCHKVVHVLVIIKKTAGGGPKYRPHDNANNYFEHTSMEKHVGISYPNCFLRSRIGKLSILTKNLFSKTCQIVMFPMELTPKFAFSISNRQRRVVCCNSAATRKKITEQSLGCLPGVLSFTSGIL